MNKYFIECRDNLDWFPEFGDKFFKLIVTSPPYNIGKPYEKTKISLDSYIASQRKVIMKCALALRDSGSIVWQVGNYVDKGEIFPLDTLLYPIFKEAGLTLRNRIIWSVGHGLHCKNRLSGRYETLNWFTKTDNYTFNLDPIRVPSKYPNKKYFKGPKKGQLSGNPLGKNPADVWHIPNVKHNHVEKVNHPAQFPVELIERLVLSMTNPGDIVFDPYMGVGTSVIAALKHNRVGVGCDVVQDYVDQAQKRIDDLEKGILKTRPMGKAIL